MNNDNNIWGALSSREEGYKKSLELFKNSLPIVSKILGKIHRLDQTITFWEPIIGIWIRYISIFYINSLQSKKVKNEYYKGKSLKDFKITTTSSEFFYDIASKKNFRKALDQFLKFDQKVKGKNYFPFKHIDKFQRSPKSTSKIIFKILIPTIFKKPQLLWYSLEIIFLILFCKIFKRDIFIANCRLSLGEIFKSILLHKIPIFRFPTFFYVLEENIKSSAIDHKLREDIQKLIETYEFREVKFLKLIFLLMPSEYIENFINRHTLSRFLPQKIKAFYSDYYHADNTFLKICLSNWKKYKANIYIGKHAGKDNILSWDTDVDHDKSISDCYLDWGINNDFENLFSVRLSQNIKKMSIFNKKKKSPFQVIYMCRTIIKYQNEIGFGYGTIEDSIKIEKGRFELARRIADDSRLKEKFFVRPRQGDIFNNGGNNIHSFERFNIKTIKKNTGWHFLLYQSSIVIFETVSTGFFECLVNKKPTILFIHENYLFFNSTNGRKFYSLCLELNLIVHDVETLVHIISGDIKYWWQNIISRKQFSHFINLFGKTSYDIISDLRKIMEKNSIEKS